MPAARHGAEERVLQGTAGRPRFPVALPFGHDWLQLLLQVSRAFLRPRRGTALIPASQHLLGPNRIVSRGRQVWHNDAHAPTWLALSSQGPHQRCVFVYTVPLAILTFASSLAQWIHVRQAGGSQVAACEDARRVARYARDGQGRHEGRGRRQGELSLGST